MRRVATSVRIEAERARLLGSGVMTAIDDCSVWQVDPATSRTAGSYSDFRQAAVKLQMVVSRRTACIYEGPHANSREFGNSRKYYLPLLRASLGNPAGIQQADKYCPLTAEFETQNTR